MFPSIVRVRWLLIEFSISVFNEEDAKAECNEKGQKNGGEDVQSRLQTLNREKLCKGHIVSKNLIRT